MLPSLIGLRYWLSIGAPNTFVETSPMNGVRNSAIRRLQGAKYKTWIAAYAATKDRISKAVVLGGAGVKR
jgi:hypothetical protein